VGQFYLGAVGQFYIGANIQYVEALFRLSADALELRDALAFGKLPRALVAVVLNHLRLTIAVMTMHVKRTSAVGTRNLRRLLDN